RGREPITARLIADLFKQAGADRLMSIHLHTSQIQGFFDGPVDHLFAIPVLVNYLRSKLDPATTCIVSPGSGRVRLAERWSDTLGRPVAFILKRRDVDVVNQVKVHEVVGQVACRTCVLVDDMIDTGGWICKAAEALYEH